MSTTGLLLMAAVSANVLQPGDYRRSLTVDGRERTYLLHVPPSYDGHRSVPLVLVFHGGGSNADQMVRFCGLNETADREGFLVVYPNGTGRTRRLLTWNAGNCCGYAVRNNVDDVKFVRELLREVAKVARVDSRRVYATGMSNGAIFCYRLADELSDRFAAIAPVSGTMGRATCAPKRPVSVLHFHGTDDLFVPYAGGRGRRSITLTRFFSVEHTIQAWVRANGCPDKPVVERLPDRADDGTWVEKKTYGPGRDGAEVVLVEIHGGGHTWPGREPPLRFLGRTTHDIAANDLIWSFFRRHHR